MADERKYRIRATANPLAIGMPSRRDPKAPPEQANPVINLAGSGVKPHPKLEGRADFELITAAEAEEIKRRPVESRWLANGKLVIEAGA